jgi:hypothetical protein
LLITIIGHATPHTILIINERIKEMN